VLFSFAISDAPQIDPYSSSITSRAHSYHFLAGDEADEIFDLEASIEGFDPMAETLAGIEFRKF